jgi:phosphate transport system permease protein
MMTNPEVTTPDPQAAAPRGPRVRFVRKSRVRQRVTEFCIERSLFLFAFASMLITGAILYILVSESVPFFREVSPLQFLFGTRWSPIIQPQSFGVLPIVSGTLIIVVLSGIVAIPLGLAIAIYLSEYAGPRQRAIIKPVLEVLAGIPTVVYGYFAVMFVTPLLQRFDESIPFFNAVSASIVVGIMILPMVASLCEDALRSVPVSLRQGAYALGATSYEATLTVVVPAALSGILAAFILAVSRALGETMAVALAAGTGISAEIPDGILQPVLTMTSYIVQVVIGDAPHGTVEYNTIFAVGLVLFMMTFALNIIANRIRKRFREVYE